jgi:transposase InsO family protein
LQGIVRAKKPRHLPVVLTRDEVSAVLAQLDGVRWIVASLLYGSGLRLLEALRLRVKDVDFARGEVLVRDFIYVSTWQGFVYVAFVIDVFARRTLAGACPAQPVPTSCSRHWSRRCMPAGRSTRAA